jgi:hypothetical protein
MKTIPFSEVREFYERNQPDGHWFDAGAIRFFKTRLPKVAYETNAGLLFITSEIDPSGNKRYSVRRQAVSGDINTVGDFHSHATRAAALAAIKRLHTQGA